MRFKKTRLWQEAFESSGDQAEKARLASVLLTMREQVSLLAASIPMDCKDLTAHDINHLDALWETADEISGPEFQLNPAEAFVFGAAVLVHDVGLTSLAYPKGREGLKATPLWAEISAQHLYSAGLESSDEISSHPLIEALAFFELLRELHASQAENICTTPLRAPGGGDTYLIGDQELRDAYGECIGKIAHSHNWPIDQVAAEFSTSRGGSPLLPQEWKIDEVKIACLLRCADAAQIDRIRAPSLIYAATAPAPASDKHWRGQNKLNRVTRVGEELRLTSSSSFIAPEAEAWWTVFDLALILDKELKASSALLKDDASNKLYCKRVSGIDSPKSFAEFVKTDKWTPIDVSVRVSDPLRLARTLGGRHLYGRDELVPFRELIQNSADAIRARRAIEGLTDSYGKIVITLDAHPNRGGKAVLTVEDNGVGMNERVLCGTLVDFGKSLWSSSDLRRELPGLRSTPFEPIGKFGIGFFSVFDLGDEVSVLSRKYDAGVGDTRVLEFNSLSSRPIVRLAASSETSSQFSTRVKVTIDRDRVIKPQFTRLHPQDYVRGPVRRHRKLISDLQRMVALLNIDVEVTDNLTGESFFHSALHLSQSSENFMQELFPEGLPEFSQEEKDDIIRRVSNIHDQQGRCVGRAALNVGNILEKNVPALGALSVGGLVSHVNFHVREVDFNDCEIPFVGVFAGEPERAARDFTKAKIEDDVMRNWISNQLVAIDQTRYRASELMKLGTFAVKTLGDSQGFPVIFHNRELRDFNYLRTLLARLPFVLCPLRFPYDTRFEVVGYEQLSPDYFSVNARDEVVVVPTGGDRVLKNDDDTRDLRREGGGAIPVDQLEREWSDGPLILKLLRVVWGTEIKAAITREPPFDTRIASLCTPRWMLRLTKAKPSE